MFRWLATCLLVASFVTGSAARAQGVAGDIAHIDRVEGALLSAVVGISTERGAGTGFFVDRCTILTAAHVVFSGDAVLAKDIKIGWGARPAGSSREPFDLAANFRVVGDADLVAVGGSVAYRAATEILATSEYGIADPIVPPMMAGDWALLRTTACLPVGHPVFTLPHAPFEALYEGARYGTGTVYGYPGADFQYVTATKCDLDVRNNSGRLVVCPLFSGNSGGPVVSDESSEVFALLSMSDLSRGLMVETNTASAAMQLHLGGPPQLGCATALKQALQRGADRNHTMVNYGPFDDSMTPEFQRAYFALGAEYAQRTLAIATTIIPATPDAQTCAGIQSLSFADGGILGDFAEFQGEWYDPGSSYGILIEPVGQSYRMFFTGSLTPDPAYHGAGGNAWGRRLNIEGKWTRDGEDFHHGWVMDLIAGRRPLLVSEHNGSFFLPIFRFLERGVRPLSEEDRQRCSEMPAEKTRLTTEIAALPDRLASETDARARILLEARGRDWARQLESINGTLIDLCRIARP